MSRWADLPSDGGEAAHDEPSRRQPPTGFLGAHNMDAQIADRIRGAVRASNGVSYPAGSLAKRSN